jgi:hypothetical protein
MSDEPKVGGVPMAFVRGGTTSAQWDADKARQRQASEERRAYQDRQYDAVEAAQGSLDTKAALLSRGSVNFKTNPKVVIEYIFRDAALNREALCEIAIVPHPQDPSENDMILVIVCPRCLERTGHMDDAQLMIRESHRKFWIDTDRARIWTNPVDRSVHNLAGDVTANDRCQCSALGCQWAFRIEKSKLWEVT